MCNTLQNLCVLANVLGILFTSWNSIFFVGVSVCLCHAPWDNRIEMILFFLLFHGSLVCPIFEGSPHNSIVTTVFNRPNTLFFCLTSFLFYMLRKFMGFHVTSVNILMESNRPSTPFYSFYSSNDKLCTQID